MNAESPPTYRDCPPHNPLKEPAVCLCAECSRYMLGLRCARRNPDGVQCGDYAGHRGEHTILVDSTFLIAGQRTR